MATRRGFGRLRERASGRWQAGYVGPDAAMHYAPETFTAKADAEAWLNSERKLIEADVDPSDPRSWTAPAERLNVRRMKGVTLNEFADAWIENHRPRGNAPIKPRTKAHYRKMLDKRILPELGHLEVRKLTAEHVKAWHKDAQELKTPTYTAHAYALLRTLMNSAVDDKLIAANPCTVKGAGVAKRATRTVPATLDELAIIVDNMPDRLQLAVLLACWCSLRFGEVTELRRSDIDLRKQLVKVRRGVVRVDGEMIVGSPKSEAGSRDVAIPPHLMALVREHLATHAQPGPSGLLFYGRDGTQITQSTFSGRPARRRKINGRWANESATGFARAREAAGRPDLRFHDLRHTGATMAAQAGATLPELMLRLGHSTPAAAMRYQHAARDRDAEIARKLSERADLLGKEPE